MANKKIESLEADLAQFRASVEERQQESNRQQQEHSLQIKNLSEQMEAVLSVLNTVSAAVLKTSPGHIPPEFNEHNSFVLGTGPKRGDKASDDGESKDPEHDGSNDFRTAKVRMPIFERDDAYGWIYRAERYFEIQGIRTEEQVRAAALCMEGPALAWYRWSERRSSFRSWEGLKRRLLDRFQIAHGGDLYEQFLAITQEGSVRDYVSLFEKMAGQLMNLPEPVLEGVFMKGLKPELRSILRIMQPDGLAHAMKLATTIEDNHDFGKATLLGGTSFCSPLGSMTSNRGRELELARNTNNDRKSIGGATEHQGQFKRLTEAELAAKQAKGICFRCDEKFTPGHRCASRTLQVLLVDEEEEIDDKRGKQIRRRPIDTLAENYPEEWGDFTP